MSKLSRSKLKLPPPPTHVPPASIVKTPKVKKEKVSMDTSTCITKNSTSREAPNRVVWRALIDALLELKKFDVPLTRKIAKRVEKVPIAWSPFLDDADTDMLGHFEEGGYIVLNGKAFQEMGNPRRRAALMLHELVHSIGGTELDSEAIEAWVFPDVTSAPTKDDKCLFRTESGRYVKRNPTTGEVRLKRTGKVIAVLK